jgi:hypothetical protein
LKQPIFLGLIISAILVSLTEISDLGFFQSLGEGLQIMIMAIFLITVTSLVDLAKDK